MSTTRARCASLLLLAAVLVPSAVFAGSPPHLVLRGAAGNVSNASQPVKVTAHPYPYGYFGATAYPRWQRQFGVNRIYTQWSQR